MKQRQQPQAAANIQRVMRGRIGRKQAAAVQQAAAIEDENRKRISANLISDVFQRSLKSDNNYKQQIL